MKPIGELISLTSQPGQSISTEVNIASTDDLYQGIGKLFAKLARRKDDTQELKLKIVAYGEALIGLPQDELAEVMLKFGDGRLGDGVFAPTAAQLAQEVRRELDRKGRLEAAARREAEQLAERRAEAERRKNLAPGAMARADAIMQRFRASKPADHLSSRQRPLSEITPSEAQHNLKTIRERVGGFCDLSDELRQRLCLPTHAEEAERDAARDDYEEE